MLHGYTCRFVIEAIAVKSAIDDGSRLLIFGWFEMQLEELGLGLEMLRDGLP
jgi:hypothetical protein